MTEVITPAVGLHANVPYAAYAKWPAINISKLKTMRRSPLHCRYEIDHPREETDALLLGKLLHVAVFEPGRLSSEFYVMPKCDRRTKEGKELYAAALKESEGKTIIYQDEMSKVQAMAAEILKHPRAKHFTQAAGMCELSMLWETQGTLCKGRLDRRVELPGTHYIVELKSTRDASLTWFPRDVHRFGYAMQAAWYCHGHEVITGQKAGHVLIAVESDPPHAVAVYMLTDASQQAGYAEAMAHLKAYAECMKSGNWHGYSENIELLDMPYWALKGDKDND